MTRPATRPGPGAVRSGRRQPGLSVELARLTPRDGSVEVRAAAGADTPLSPLASAARTSARKVLGRSDQPSHSPVLVALDTSASMLPVFAGGGAAAAVDVVVGVAAAVGITDVSAALIGEEAVRVECGAAAELAEAVEQADAAVERRRPLVAATRYGGPYGVCTDFPDPKCITAVRGYGVLR